MDRLDFIAKQTESNFLIFCSKDTWKYSSAFHSYFKVAQINSYGDFVSSCENGSFSIAQIHDGSGGFISETIKNEFCSKFREYMMSNYTKDEIDGFLKKPNVPEQTTPAKPVVQTSVTSSQGLQVHQKPLSTEIDIVSQNHQSPTNLEKNFVDVEKLFSKAENLYWIYLESEYKDSCIIDGEFSTDNFEFEAEEIDKPNKPNPKKWRFNPKTEADECVANLNKGETPRVDFPLFFSRFAFEIFKRLGKVYLYQILNEIAKKVSSKFCAMYNFNRYFKEFKKSYPEDKFSKLNECSKLLEKKLKHKFIYRAHLLKSQPESWPYRPQDRNDDRTPKHTPKRRASMKPKALTFVGTDQVEINADIDLEESKQFKCLVENIPYKDYYGLLSERMYAQDEKKPKRKTLNDSTPATSLVSPVPSKRKRNETLQGDDSETEENGSVENIV